MVVSWQVVKSAVLVVVFTIGVTRAHAVTLTEAIEAGLLFHPSLESADASYRARLSDIDIERAGYFPTVDLSAGAGKEYTENSSTRAGGEGGTTLSAAESQLTIVQPIYNGFETGSRVAQAQANALAAREDLSSQRLKIALDITSAYIRVLRAERLIAVSRKDIAKHEEILVRVKQRVEDGGGLPVNVDQTLERLSLARSAVASAEERFFSAKSEFSSLTGLPAENFVSISSLLGVVPASLGEAVERAIVENPSILGVRQEVRAAELGIDIANSAFWPTVDLEGTASQNMNQGGVRGPDRDRSVLIRFNFNLFNGGADTAALKGRRRDLQRARADLERALLDLRRDLELAYITLAERRERLSYEQARYILNEKVVEGYEQQFLFGARTLLELLSAYGSLYSNEQVIVETENDILNEQFQILFLIGTSWYSDTVRSAD